MSILRTYNVQNPDSASTNIELSADGGISVAGIVTATGGLTVNAGASVSGVITATGGIVVAAGSTSAPSISPSGDSNTGIFFPSPDTIAFGEGGVESLRFTSSGTLGIGTNNTNSRQLSVYGLGFNGTQIEARGTLLNSAGLSMYSGKNYEIQSTSTTEANYPNSFLVYDRDNDGYRLIVDGSGRVTMPSQPGFLVTGSFTSPPGSAINSFSTIKYNIGSHYNNTNGKFTCPVAGKYLATASFLTNTTNNFTLYNFYLNTSAYTNGWHQVYSYTQASGHCITSSMVISASANDTIELQFNSSYNTPYTSGYGYMSINLIG